MLINYQVCGTFCTLYCILIFGKMLKINFLKFFKNLLVSIFPVKILYLGKYKEFVTDFCFVFSLTCPLYYYANNSIFTIGYLFMCGITFTFCRNGATQYACHVVAR